MFEVQPHDRGIRHTREWLEKAMRYLKNYKGEAHAGYDTSTSEA